MATVADVRNQAAEKLALYGAGQTLQAREAADLKQAYREVFTALTVKGQAPWDYTGSVDDLVPDEYAPLVASLVARSRIVQYKPPPERAVMIQAEAADAEQMIRELNRETFVEVMRAEYY